MNKMTIVILANSVKHHQHCIAGKTLQDSQWVRLVSDKCGAELSHEQVKYENPYGKFNVKPLQKVIVGIAKAVPLTNQPENQLIDESAWQQNYSLKEKDLVNYVDTPTSLWGEGDRVSYQQIQSGQVKIPQSLYLVQVDALNLYRNQHDKRRVSFSYNGINYDLAVTDPNFDKMLANASELMGILCVSLGEKFEGNCFKLVATVF